MKIAVNTGGGDAPGLNAVISGVVLAAYQKGWEVFGIKYGYKGLIDTKQINRLTPESVWNITDVGGTILGSAIRGNPFRYPAEGPEGKVVETDISDTIVSNFKTLGFDALVAIGGDGSLGIASKFMKKGMPIIGAAENPLLASQRSVNIYFVTGLAWSISIFSAGLTAILSGANYGVSLFMGHVALKAFAVALVGGLDGLGGIIPAAFLIALAELTANSYVNPRLANTIPFIIMIIVLMTRPWGFFGTEEEIERV